MKLKHWLGLLISLLFIIWIQWQLGWQNIVNSWNQLSTGQLIAAAGMILISHMIRSFRIYLYYINQLKNKWLITIKIHLQHNFYNNMLPIRAGEFTFPILMKQHFDLGLAQSTGMLIWFRLLDLQAVFLCALWALYSLNMLNPKLILLSLTVTMLAPFLLIAPSIQNFIVSIGDSTNHKIIVEGSAKPNIKHRLSLIAKRLMSGLPRDSFQFYSSWLLTLLNWLVKILTFACILNFFYPMGLNIAIIGAVGGEATSLLPVHGFAGIGSYEAGVAGALVLLEQPQEAALAGAINLHLFIILSTVLGMLFSSLIKNNLSTQS